MCGWPGLWGGKGEHREGRGSPGEVVNGHRKSPPHIGSSQDGEGPGAHPSSRPRQTGSLLARGTLRLGKKESVAPLLTSDDG